ncbi:S-formylglutathione hydrolase [Candidatus Uabimicrobium amorphum]|uniref:S-formylglutathione hydrolase n=1 Tax=Uabimicrobium amorphum TaxID=2596890 RepID=A0A5S9ISW9_UABAM|nr:S-formylglutathione hydrolase [Candidatus Uabimicrobium amorphum]BBM87026.1 S-formylglutathione hydrolase [Candidatus Uabimicrobium amorphum]
MTTINRTSSKSCFGGKVEFYKHSSSSCNCEMSFSIFIPQEASTENKLPVLYWLSGLECTEKNFMEKSGAQRCAAENSVIIVAPDTSPRGCNIEGEDESWDFGSSAGFYVNATQEKWKNHYNMYDYVVTELPKVIAANFPVNDKKSISGHSMGGHGAMMIAIRNPEEYYSVSAFAPICAPSLCPWGEKAFGGYLGDDKNTWKMYDSNCLVETATQKIPILIEMGACDPFRETQLHLETFHETCQKHEYPLTANIHEGYDHSYYFVASFIEKHIEYHAQHLRSLS